MYHVADSLIKLPIANNTIQKRKLFAFLNACVILAWFKTILAVVIVSAANPQDSIGERPARDTTAPRTQDAGAAGQPVGAGGLRHLLQARNRREPARA